jgi:heme exporter protein B
MSAESGFLAKVRLLARKDLTIEARGRDTLPPMIAFALTVILLLAFALPSYTGARITGTVSTGTVALADVLAGFFWITILFAGLIGFARSFEVERDDGALEALLLAPLDRSGLFVSKLVTNLVFILAIEAVLVPTFTLLFRIDYSGHLWIALIVMLLVDVGFVAIGTIFSAVAAQTRSSELLLPILALPALVPVFVAGVELLSDLFSGAAPAAVAARGWFAILIAYDVIFVTVGVLAFEFIIDQ